MNISFAVVKYISFLEFVFSSNDDIRDILRRTLREDLTRSNGTHKPALVERISRFPDLICVGVDWWTSESQKRNQIAVVITSIEKWE